MKTFFTALLFLGYIFSTSAQIELTRVKEINPTGNSFPKLTPKEQHVIYNNNLYFNAYDGVDGYDLWKTDGTDAGTQKVKNFSLLPSQPAEEFLTFNGKFYFRQDGKTWMSDGTTQGTVEFKFSQTQNLKILGELKAVNNQLIGCAQNDSFQVGLYALAVGATEPIFLSLLDFDTWRNQIVVGNKIFFTVQEQSNHKLHFTDGTIAGTQKIVNVNVLSQWFSKSWLHAHNNEVYFAAASDSSTVELWRSNGTLVGTTMVKDFNGFVSASPQVFTTYNGLVYFTAKEPSSVRTLWKTDGTEAGTVRVKNVDVGNTMIYFFSPGGVEKMLFTATDSVHGSEMWISDGTELGTNILIDVEPGKVSSWPSNFYQINDKLLFFGGSNSNTSGLWITDGTENGTKRIENFSGYMGIPYPRFARLHDKVFFIASDTAKKPEIWVTDGTEDSTYKIAVPDTTIPKPIDNTYFKFVSYNNELYFEGEYDNTGRELWKITYTPSTTKLTNTEVSSYIVYPNPTTGKVVIIDEAQLIKRVVVKNIVGEVLKQESGNVKSVDLTDFPSGLYLFNIDTDNSTEVVKVVKQ